MYRDVMSKEKKIKKPQSTIIFLFIIFSYFTTKFYTTVLKFGPKERKKSGSLKLTENSCNLPKKRMLIVALYSDISSNFCFFFIAFNFCKALSVPQLETNLNVQKIKLKYRQYKGPYRGSFYFNPTGLYNS